MIGDEPDLDHPALQQDLSSCTLLVSSFINLATVYIAGC